VTESQRGKEKHAWKQLTPYSQCRLDANHRFNDRTNVKQEDIFSEYSRNISGFLMDYSEE